MKRIVLTGGGTAGHVTPHLAILPTLLEEGYDVHYIGTSGMEKDIMSREQVTFHTVKSGKLRRYLSLKNLTDPFRVIAGAFQAAAIIRKLKPDVCFSKGGFVSVPVVFGASLHHVPILCHESDLTPGLANKLTARFATKIATTFPECAEALGKKAVCTGSPIRASLFTGTREKGLQLCGLDGNKPVLMMMGGSSGAQAVNKALRDSLPELLGTFDIVHITGKGNLDESLMSLNGYKQFDYVNETLPDLMAAADLVLSRAGSNALCEFHALKKPMLLVPYPKGAGRGDQVLNAHSYEKRGLAMVLEQQDLNAGTLTAALLELNQKKDEYRERLNNDGAANGTQKILDMIHEIQR